MKVFTSLLFGALFIVSASAQEVYRWYQDGKVIFQLEENVPMPKTANGQVEKGQMSFLNGLSGQFGIQSIKHLHPDINDRNLVRTYQIEFSEIERVDELVEIVGKSAEVAYAEKKELHESFLTPNDQYYTNSFNNGQWALFQIDADLAWDISTGSSSIIVAVTDNAIQTAHPDLVNKLVPGYDAAENDNDPSPCGGNDGFHGSHVSGIVGAETNNNIGIASIGFDVSIMPVKIGNCATGALTAGYDGIIWAADNGAHVINMSWGGGGQSTYGQNVCTYAWNEGSILVAAAGNDGVSSVFYPAGYNNVISVASSTNGDAKSSFSNYGSWIDVTAPGSSILSCNENTGYQFTQGTSMASPMVAGLVGLMISHAPSTSQQDVVNCLLSSCDNIDGANPSYIGQLGAGRINAHQALLCMNQYTFTLDVGIAEISSPEGAICGSSVDPVVELKNYGANTITQVDINYQVDAGPVQTLNWTGSLAQGQSDIVSLPTQTPGAGAHNLTVFTSSPNARTDQNSSNDSETSNFTIIANGQIADLTIITDCYGSEISWTIEEDGTGIQWAQGGGYANVTGGETINESVCLESGCYVFTIDDTYGDGLYGSQWTCTVDGDYFMDDASGSNLFSMTAPNGDFGNQATHNFCITSNLTLDAGVSNIIDPNGSYCSSSITPTVELYNYGSTTLTSVDIVYNTGGANQVFNWSGSLAQGASTAVTLPAITVSSGSYTFSASTDNPNSGTDQNTVNDLSTNSFAIFTSALPLPFQEDFESNSFATNSWTIDNPDAGITWEITTIAGSAPGDKAAKMDFYNYGNGSERDGMQTPPLDFSSYTNVSMTYDHAFRRYNTSSADSMIIYVSTDCGNTFDRIVGYAEDGTGSFATATTNTAPFTPGNGDWCTGTVGANCFTVNLGAYDGQPSVIVRFEGFNNGIAGNNLFIDNINIDGTLTSAPPIADFSSNTQELCEGNTVSFTDQSNGAPTSWLWDFGDGNTSTQQNPTHTYAAAGTYTVTMTASNAFGSDVETITNYITVYGPVSYSQNLTICDGGSVSVGSSTYTTAGTYTDVLVGPTGCDSTVTTTLAVNPLPTVDLTSPVDTLCEYHGSQTLVGTPAGGTYSGPGMAGSTFDPNQAGVGTHTISYTFTDGNGCAGSSSVSIMVDACLSVENQALQSLSVYPNPTQGEFIIDGLSAGTQVIILDAIGKQVAALTAKTQLHTMQLNDLETGVYYVRAIKGEYTKVIPIILSK